jgi:hypothetical protein
LLKNSGSIYEAKESNGTLTITGYDKKVKTLVRKFNKKLMIRAITSMSTAAANLIDSLVADVNWQYQNDLMWVNFPHFMNYKIESTFRNGHRCVTIFFDHLFKNDFLSLFFDQWIFTQKGNMFKRAKRIEYHPILRRHCGLLF